MSFVDFHSHILPHMDDGAKDADTSLGMLSALASQGVSTVYATPHFYADENSVEEFLQRRSRAYAELLAAMEGKEGLPEVRLGAEIMMCKHLAGIDLSGLVFNDIPLMLFEYPVAKFEGWYARYTAQIAAANAATAMVAHFDRYEWISPKTVDELCRADGSICFQMNCEGLEKRSNLRLLTELYEKGRYAVFGTDCHDLKNRAPDFDKLTRLFSERSVKLDSLGFKRVPADYLQDALYHSQKRVQSTSDSNGLLV